MIGNSFGLYSHIVICIIYLCVFIIQILELVYLMIAITLVVMMLGVCINQSIKLSILTLSGTIIIYLDCLFSDLHNFKETVVCSLNFFTSSLSTVNLNPINCYISKVKHVYKMLKQFKEMWKNMFLLDLSKLLVAVEPLWDEPPFFFI